MSKSGHEPYCLLLEFGAEPWEIDEFWTLLTCSSSPQITLIEIGTQTLFTAPRDGSQTPGKVSIGKLCIPTPRTLHHCIQICANICIRSRCIQPTVCYWRGNGTKLLWVVYNMYIHMCWLALCFRAIMERIDGWRTQGVGRPYPQGLLGRIF